VWNCRRTGRRITTLTSSRWQTRSRLAVSERYGRPPGNGEQYGVPAHLVDIAVAAAQPEEPDHMADAVGVTSG
jgi:hypothetical protein